MNINYLHAETRLLFLYIVRLSFCAGGTKLKNMYWYWIHAYCGDTCIGSTYTSGGSRENVIRVLNEEFGEGNWTRYTIE